ncbi:MAG: hypothetical protein SVV88_11640 [Pseudomonadota bacterium]|nr:hypothetical protein [Pseudomonadota bacterium]
MMLLEALRSLLSLRGFTPSPLGSWYIKLYDSGIQARVCVDPDNCKLVLTSVNNIPLDSLEYRLVIEADLELGLIYSMLGGDLSDPTGSISFEPLESFPRVSNTKSHYISYSSQLFQTYCKVLLVPSDFLLVGDISYKNRFAWVKLARAFNISDELVRLNIARDDTNHVIYAEAVVRATTPEGRTVMAAGYCSLSDKSHTKDLIEIGELKCIGPCDGRKHFTNPDHEIPSTAITRAKNRAISDILGAGELSAEEVI